MTGLKVQPLFVLVMLIALAPLAAGQTGSYPTIITTPAPGSAAPVAAEGAAVAPAAAPAVAPAQPIQPVSPQLIQNPAIFNGAAAAPPPNFDPFAPQTQASPTIFSQDPYLPQSGPSLYVTSATKFFQRARFDYMWMAGNGVGELGLHDISIDGTFAFPFCRNTETPLLVTPGFALQLWDGPKDQGAPPTADMPPNTFSAYIDTAWKPILSPVVSGELAFRIGVYSDFNKVSSEALRYTGAGFVVVKLTPNYTLKGGVMYLDRNKVKVLPSGGLIITPAGPEGDIRLEILFPNPKLAMRIPNSGPSDWWMYARMDYGGGNWAVQRTAGFTDSVDYNDIRLAVGFETQGKVDVTTIFEVGLAFNRQLVYKSGLPSEYDPNSTVFLRAALFF